MGRVLRLREKLLGACSVSLSLAPLLRVRQRKSQRLEVRERKQLEQLGRPSEQLRFS